MRFYADLWNSIYPVISPNDNHRTIACLDAAGPLFRRGAPLIRAPWPHDGMRGSPALWRTASALHRVRDDRVARLHGFVRECPDDDVRDW